MKNKNQFANFYAAFNAAKLPFSKEEFVLMKTNGRTSSLKELTVGEYGNIIKELSSQNLRCIDPKMDNMRKTIIALYLTKYKGQSPAEAKRWAEKQGVRYPEGMVHKKFNHYNDYELTKLIDAAKRMVDEEDCRISKL